MGYRAAEVQSARTGAVISSAGLTMAGTFAVLASLPLTVLFQLGACVAAGVLVDAFLVRPLIVPGLVLWLGPFAWWPGEPPRPGSNQRGERHG